MHHVTIMLESNSYVRCLATDISKAFDIVDHEILLHKVSLLDLPPNIHNWLLSFITGRQQKCKLNGSCSYNSSITRGIIQSSTIGPTVYIIIKNNLLPFLRATAGTAIARLSHRNSVCLSVHPSVCHTGGSGKNSAS